MAGMRQMSIMLLLVSVFGPACGLTEEEALSPVERIDYEVCPSARTASMAGVQASGALPEGCDGVVPVEETEEIAGGVRFFADLAATGTNIRPAGEDVQVGDHVLAPGQILRPTEIGLLAALGVNDVSVTRRPRVGFMATGDELLAPLEVLEGTIHEPVLAIVPGSVAGISESDTPDIREFLLEPDPEVPEAYRALIH